MRKFLKSAAATLLAAGAGSAHAASLYAGNGHMYEFVAEGLSWQDALAAAAAATPISGYSAHLVTITDAGEDAFVKALTGNASYVWAAGTDEASEGIWKWAAGPEAGQTFYVLGGPQPLGSYNNWNPGEPNNSGTENYIHFKANAGDWNDIYATFPSGGYVIEYSLNPIPGVPEPATWAMMIFGFGAVGTSMRRRTKVRVAYS